MKFIYREQAVLDLAWFEEYYKTIFIEGCEKAKIHFFATRNAILKFPEIGKTIEHKKHIREFIIIKTPFSFIYYLSDTDIVVLRICHNRAVRPKLKV